MRWRVLPGGQIPPRLSFRGRPTSWPAPLVDKVLAGLFAEYMVQEPTLVFDRTEVGDMDEGIIWQPTPATVAGSNLSRFMHRCGVDSLAALQARAEADPAWFWAAVEQDLQIHWYEPYTRVLDTSGGVEWARWFSGGKMNLAADCADKHAAGPRRDQVAVLYEGEDGTVRRWTYAELLAESNRVAGLLTDLGIGPGDRVGVFMPMVPEIVAVILGVAKIGAVFTPIFSGYAPQAAATRLTDCGARVLFTADGYFRRGKAVNMKEVADAACALAPGVEQVVVLRRTGAAVPWTPGRDRWYHEAVAGQSPTFATRPVSPEDPCMIIYTSGTTGKPKGTVHVHGGFPLKGAQDMAHCFDVQPGDIMFWFTDIGWMMGPWLIFGTLMLGATCFLYDGAPDSPGPDRIWAMVARHRVTHLGLSPTLIRALMPLGDEHPRRHDLSSLRILGGTGEPWNPDPYLWFFRHAGGGRCPIINYSGGTEISGGIVCCVPIRPLKVCSFNCAIPGMAAAVVDDTGRPVPPGTVGELVIRAPWPGMTRGFWQDPERYVSTYWQRFPGVWVHGDWASVDADGFWYIHGRSDDTLKVAGKRVGPAEVEGALVSHPAVAEAAAVGVPHERKGEGVVCFVVLRPGHSPDDGLRQALRQQVAAALGKPLMPEQVYFTVALPKTRNAKIMRRVIRAVYLGQPPGDLTSLENPEALDDIARAR